MTGDFGLERERRLTARESPPFDPIGGSSAFTGKVTTAAGSIAVGSYLMVNPVVVTGAETEGGAGSFLVDTGTFVPVYLVGPGTPAPGAYVVCHQAGYRWVCSFSCVCKICALMIDSQSQAALPTGRITITYYDSTGAAVGTDSASYAPPDTEVCFLPAPSPAWQSYALSGTSADSPYARASTASAAPCCPAVPLPGCGCSSVPATLQMHVNDPTLNYGMFQDSQLLYGPTPAWATSLSIGTHQWFSPDWYTDQITGDQFIYFFTCYTGQYALGRLYQTSTYGSPYRDIFRYSWTAGISGNTCVPFLLETGTIFAGGDPASHVSVNTRGTF